MCTSAKGSTYAVAAETGPDTGVFEMEVALTGYALTTAQTIHRLLQTHQPVAQVRAQDMI